MTFFETLIIVGMPAIFAFIGYLLPVPKYSFDLDHIRFDRHLLELEHCEMLLRSVRRDKRRIKWQGLNAEWQAVAACYDLTDFEFEWFLIFDVWASRGEQFTRYRLNKSPYRREIEQVNKRQIKTTAYA